MNHPKGFQPNGTVQLFGTKGQKFLHCPGTKGQAQNIATGQDGPGQPVKSQDGMRDGLQDAHYFSVKSEMGQHYFFPMITCFRTSFPVF